MNRYKQACIGVTTGLAAFLTADAAVAEVMHTLGRIGYIFALQVWYPFSLAVLFGSIAWRHWPKRRILAYTLALATLAIVLLAGTDLVLNKSMWGKIGGWLMGFHLLWPGSYMAKDVLRHLNAEFLTVLVVTFGSGIVCLISWRLNRSPGSKQPFELLVFGALWGVWFPGALLAGWALSRLS